MREPSEKTKWILSIVLSLALLAGLMPITGVFSENPPAWTLTGTQAPTVTLPPVTTAPIIQPEPETNVNAFITFPMENELPDMSAALLHGTSDVLGSASADSGRYLTLYASKGSESGVLWGLPSLSFNFRGAENAQANESCFTLELTFIQNDAPVPLTLSLLADTNMTTEGSSLACAETILSLSQDGSLCLGAHTLGNVTEKTVAVSVIFVYDSPREIYTADVYVNELLFLSDLVYAKIGGIAAKAIAEDETQGISGITLSSDAVYTDAASGTVSVGGITYTPTHYNAFDDNGTLKYSIKVDDLYFIKGSTVPRTERNASTLVLYTNGKTLDGFTPTSNDPNVVSARVTAENGEVVLPEIEGGWRYPSETSFITIVSSALLSRSTYAAYSPLPDLTIYENSFTAGTDGLTNNSGVTHDRDGAKLLLAKDAQLGYSFGTLFSDGYDPTVALAVSLTLARLSDRSSSLTLSLSGKDNTETPLLSMNGQAISFGDGELSCPLPAIGEQTEIAMQINFSISGVTLTVYIDGMYIGHTALADSPLTVFTSLATDLGGLTLSVDSDSTDAAFALHSIALSRGAAAPIVAPLPNAFIRIGDSSAETGLRFTFAVNRAWFEVMAKNKTASAGALILPNDKIPEGTAITHQTLEELNEALDDEDKILYLDFGTETFSMESTPYTYIFNTSLVDILLQNNMREFTAIGYVRIDGAYYYSIPSNSCSIYTAAREYAQAGLLDDSSEEARAYVLGWLDSGILINESGELIEIANYTSPYTVSYENGTLSIRVAEGSGGSLENILSLCIGGRVYTKGWSIRNGVLTANWPSR